MLTTHSLTNAAPEGSGGMLLPVCDLSATGEVSVEVLEGQCGIELTRAALDAIEDEHNQEIQRKRPEAHPDTLIQSEAGDSHPKNTEKANPPNSHNVPESSQGAAPVVFISYATPNRTTAAEVCSWVEQEDLPLWIAPMNPEPGCSYNEAISNALSACEVVVLILSADSVKSAHVMREVEFAVEEKKIVIPFIIEAVELPTRLRYLLAGIQHIDATTGPLSQHRESLVNAVWKRLSELGVPEHSGC